MRAAFPLSATDGRRTVAGLILAGISTDGGSQAWHIFRNLMGKALVVTPSGAIRTRADNAALVYGGNPHISYKHNEGPV